MRQLTPLMQQYLELKKKYKDSILLFQMGDFFECFYDDAKTLAKELNITLTSREKNKDAPPLAGFPIKALNSYLPQLIEKGYKVAIAEQVEDPKQAKGIVARKVTEVVTKGTFTDPDQLDSKEANNIVSIAKDKQYISIVYTDILAGKIYLTTLPQSATTLISETLKNLNPKEVILDTKTQVLEDFSINTPKQFIKAPSKAKELILNVLKIPNLDSLDIETDSELQALSILLKYITETKQITPKHISTITRWDPRAFMFLDSMTIFNLELFRNQRTQSKEHSLIHSIDFTLTSMGARLLRYFVLHPLLDIKKINTRLKHTEVYTDNPNLLETNRKDLEQVYDIERMVGLLGFAKIAPKQLIMLKNSLQISLSLIKANKSKIPFKSDIQHIQKVIDLINNAILETPSNVITQGGIFKDSYNTKIKELRKLTNDSQTILNEILEKERTKTQINTLKLGYNKVFGYYFEVPKGQISKVPEYFIRKQTLVNNERYITPEIKELETKILGAQEELIVLEQQLYNKFILELQSFISLLQEVSKYIAYLDVINSFAFVALKRKYTRPHFLKDAKKEIVLENSRHPVVELFNKDFIANSLTIEKDKNFIILTGPNMGGKSTFIRQVALIQLMAQIGAFVPAEKAELQIKDRIFARVGASDDIASGRSTFMVEMSEVAKIIKNATKDSLIILDEVGRGTNTAEGFSLAYAISKYIAEKINAFTIFATHYHELTALTTETSRFINYKVNVLEQDNDVFFLHTISPGSTDKSYGIYVAQLVNLPEEIITLANQKLTELNQEKFELKLRESKATIPTKKSGLTAKTNNNSSQLALFSSNNPKFEKIKSHLKDIDVNKMTPIQALNLLYELDQIIKE